MALNKTTLEAAIKTAFETAKNTPPPDDPAQSDAVQDQILTQLSADLANAIDAFIRGGDVVEIAVQVRNPSDVLIGEGTQEPGSVGRVT